MKQFTIAQDQCAMKVTADAVLFGAWAPVTDTAVKALDVGCGTGLLSLMLAQRFPRLLIDAVELESAAATQAKANVSNSRFRNRISIAHADARAWGIGGYDVIICNPPFYADGPQSMDRGKSMAWHEGSLSDMELSVIAANLLASNGQLMLLLPVAAKARWYLCLRNAGLRLRMETAVAHSSDKIQRRIFCCWQKAAVDLPVAKQRLTRDSAEATCLLADFNLFF